ncbi:beta strand repeat-containing protein [Roseibacillus persicicus]|uniref:Autotransporter-associated beta strand repeat-containing protein n=1 Tax=Roseibacillus persicicus TaxID=454148 RepID=A0A918TYR7_9BACT|nr:autotransporter-associated beta strand repeat-containing protein [Roseibacillus persicicus]GHC67383.1 hypothetical protein GCM10007100_39270 [Roseibacillus persicicus]
MKFKYPMLLSAVTRPLLVVATFAGSLSAASISWDGDTSTDFASDANWVGNLAPSDDLLTDTAVFSGPVTANQPELSLGDRSVFGLDFQSGGWTLGGSSTLFLGGDITSAGDNEIAVRLNVANAELKTISAAAGTSLVLNDISADNANRGNLTIGGEGTIYMEGVNDNPYLTATIASGTTVVNKGTPGGTADNGSAFFNVTVNAEAALEFGENRTNRGLIGQIAGTATVNGTLDLKGDGTVGSNWNFGGLSGSGIVTNTGTGDVRIGTRTGVFAGELNNGSHVTSLLVQNSGSGRFEMWGSGDFSGGIVVNNDGVVWLRSNAALGAESNTITLDSGKLQNRDSNTVVAPSHEIILGDGNGTFQAGWGKWIAIQGLVSGPGQLTIAADSGIVYMDGTANTYEGGTVINGFLQAKAGGTFGLETSPITFNGGTLKNNNASIELGARDINIGADGATIIVGWGNGNRRIVSSGVIQGEGQLTVGNDTGALWLQGVANTYAGGTVIEGAGKIQAVGDGSLGSDILGVTLDGGTLTNLDSELNLAATRVITLTENGGTLTAGWAKLLAAAGLITGPGQLTIGADSGFVYLDHTANDFTGGLLVNGIVRPLENGSLGDLSGVVTMDGGTFYPSLSDVTFPDTRSFTLAEGGGTFTSNGTTTLEGGIGGAGDLIVNGDGVLALTGTNTYTGDTYVNSGVLSVGDGSDESGIADDSTVYVQFPGVIDLNFSGTDTIGRLVVDGVQVDAGVYTEADLDGAITGSGSLTVTNGPALTVPNIIDVAFDESGNVVLTLDGSEFGLTVQQSNDLSEDSFADIPSTPGTNTLTIDAGLVDPDEDNADFYRVRN